MSRSLASGVVCALALTAVAVAGETLEQAVARRVRAAVDADEHIARSGRSALRDLGPAAVPVLARYMARDEPAVRAVVARTLGALGRERHDAVALTALRKAIPRAGDRELVAIAEAAVALGPKMGDLAERLLARKAGRAAGREIACLLPRAAVVDRLLEAARDGALHERRRAVDALGKVLQARALPRLTTCLADPDDELRRRACASLGAYGAEARAAVDALAGLLTDRWVRAEAAAALGRIGAPAVPRLLRVVRAGGEPRVFALRALGGRAAAGAVPVLAGMLGDEEAREALARIGGPAVPALVARLKGSRRYEAVVVLGKIGRQARSAVGPLSALLTERDARLRVAAAEALVATGEARARAAVRPLLKDPNARARVDVARALGDAAALARALEGGGGEYDELRWLAAEGLFALGEGAGPATPALARALAGDPSLRVRLSAARALGATRGAAALPALLAATRQAEKDVRYAVVTALGQHGGGGATRLAEVMAGDAEVYIRRRAARALVELGRAAAPARAAIVAQLGHADHERRRLAVQALGRIGEQEAEPALRGMLGDAVADVRFDAVVALGRIGAQEAETLAALRAMVTRWSLPRRMRDAAAAALARIDAGGSRRGD